MERIRNTAPEEGKDKCLSLSYCNTYYNTSNDMLKAAH